MQMMEQSNLGGRKMDTCHKCGADLREDAKFCSRCGTPVQRTVFCYQCGAELNAEDQFCYACGTSMKETASAHSHPLNQDGMPNKVTTEKAKKETTKTIVYPDVCGLYPGTAKRISISDRAIVFTSGSSYLYRVDKDMNGLYRQGIYFDAIAQTKDGILALEADYNTEQAILYTLDDRLQTISGQPLFDISVQSGYEPEYRYAMNARWAVAMNSCKVDDDQLGNIEQDFIIRCADLESGEVSEWVMEHPEVEGKQIIRMERMLIDKNFLYLSGGVLSENKKGEPTEDAAAFRFDLQTGQFELLWLEDHAEHYYGNYYGRPCFYDFEHQIMWTFPRKMEMKRRNWEIKHTALGDMLPLVPRKLKKNSPILANYRIYPMVPIDYYKITYFDQNNGFIYVATDYYHMYAIFGEQISSDWCQFNHGCTEETVGWNGYLIADLHADYSYKVYRMEFERDEHNPGVDLNVEDVTPK